MDNVRHSTLLKIPLEMMWEVANQLPLKSIASLCRVNKQLHSMVEHQLYVRDAKSTRPASLQWAVSRGQMETARKAIAAGTEINAFLFPRAGEFQWHSSHPSRYRTPLSVALLHGQCDMAVFLLQNGADPSVYRQNFHIPLHLATKNGYIAVMEMCLERSQKEVNMVDREHLTPLGHALHGQNESATRLLIRQNDITFNPTSASAFENVLKHVVWACRSENIELLRLLLERVDTISEEALCNGFVEACRPRSYDMVPWVRLLLQTPLPILALYAGLSEACQGGSLEVAREIINTGHDFSNVSLDVDGSQPTAFRFPPRLLRPVQAACEAGQTALVGLLHENGFDLERLDEHGLYPLHYASASGNMETIQALLDSGIEPDVMGTNSHDSLDLAVKKGRLETFEYFLALGIDPLRRRADGSTLLHRACQAGKFELIERLFELGIQVDATENNANLTAFEILIQRFLPCNSRGEDYENVVKLFTRHPSAKNSGLLEKALRRRSFRLMELILKFSGTDGRGEMNELLHDACRHGSTPQMKMLIRCGASMRDPNKEGYLPIHHVVQPNQHSVPALEVCIMNGASMTEYTKITGSSLRKAIRKIYGSAGGLTLSSRGLQTEAVEHVRAPLHWACMGGHDRLARVLCIHGADVDRRDGQGMTPLQHACESASHACAKLLLEGGCDVNAESRDADGKRYNALTLAKKNKRSRIPGLLRKYGAVEIEN